jgi:hypothetical protein
VIDELLREFSSLHIFSCLFMQCTYFEAVVPQGKNTTWVQNDQKKITSKTHIAEFSLMEY